MTNNSSNATTEPLPFECIITTDRIIYMTIYCIIIFLVISGNIFVLKKFLFTSTTKTERTNLELLIIYLSSFDLVASIVIIVDVYENLTCFQHWLFGYFGCMTIYQLYHVSLNMSICILLIMSIDRCRSLVRPMRQKISKKAIHITVNISIVVSVLIQWYQITNITYKNNKCVYMKSKYNYALPKIIITTIRDFIFIIIFTVTSVWIYIALVYGNFLSFYTERKKQEIKRVVIMLIVMEVVFTLLVLPYDIFDVTMLISRVIDKPISTKNIYHVDFIFSILQMCNSFANCFIYAKMHRYIKIRGTTRSNSVRNENNRSRRISNISISTIIEKRRSTKKREKSKSKRDSIQSSVITESMMNDRFLSMIDNRDQNTNLSNKELKVVGRDNAIFEMNEQISVKASVELHTEYKNTNSTGDK